MKPPLLQLNVRVFQSKLITTNTSRRDVRKGEVVPQSYNILKYLLTQDEFTFLEG